MENGMITNDLESRVNKMKFDFPMRSEIEEDAKRLNESISSVKNVCSDLSNEVSKIHRDYVQKRDVENNFQKVKEELWREVLKLSDASKLSLTQLGEKTNDDLSKLISHMRSELSTLHTLLMLQIREYAPKSIVTQLQKETKSLYEKSKTLNNVIVNMENGFNEIENISSMFQRRTPHVKKVFIKTSEKEDVKNYISDSITKRYMFVTEKKTYFNALKLCEQRGGTLAIIESNEENQFIYENLLFAKTYWIGAIRKEKMENKFVFLTGKDVDYSHWSSSEPKQAQNLNCVNMKHGDWFVDDCNRKASFICQQYLNSSTDTNSQFESMYEKYASDILNVKSVVEKNSQKINLVIQTINNLMLQLSRITADKN
ncbi:hypothetical protein B4U80_13394 [Leptotrombidium deliense]|uniref:C-type lectin domain-containing protein n=1 Tax=Leptotrombidium deliense TaxID=299467 RepID=A0A443S751_9ACAR|nr:hypothetical protein B4U80_13394 [Leptotrombidium deliense]